MEEILQSNTKIIIAEAFGKRKGGTCLSNRALYKTVLPIIELMRKTKTHPLLLVHEDLAMEIERGRITDTTIKIIRGYGKPLEAFTVITNALEMLGNGNHSAFIVSHPDELWRITMVAKKLGINPLIPEFAIEIPPDPESSQWRTRGKWRYRILWEIPARIFYLITSRI